METGKSKNKLSAWRLLGLSVLMFGFGFALVPIYNTICQVTGLNGKTNSQPIEQATEIDRTRTVQVNFLATQNSEMPSGFEFKQPPAKFEALEAPDDAVTACVPDFYQQSNRITVHPGESRTIHYYARNNTDKTIIMQAIPSVAPAKASLLMKKTECFCFTRQTLKPGECKDLALRFHLDSKLPKDVTELSLSYTLFDVTDKKFKENKQAGKIS